MRLPIVLFLSLTAFGVAFASPGILARCSNEGLQTLADAAVKQLRGRLNEGMQLSDLSGSLSSYGGSGDYSLTDIKITNVNLNDLTVRVNPGSGLTVSVGKMEALIKGNFRYTYKVWFIPTSNGGTFTLTIRGASIAVEVTVGMSPDDGQPAVDFRDCFASVEDLDLSFEANFANWIVNRFKDTVKEKIKPTLKDGVCDAIKNSRNLIAEVVAKNTKPCLQGNSCNIRIDLSLVSPPIFGENYIETSHRGEIFWKNDTGLAPYEALPFETLPPSKKMVDLYFNSYVANTALYTLHQNDLLSYKFTTSDQPEACPNVLATSCENSSLCIGSVFASVFARFPNAFVELNFITASPPFVSLFNDSLSVALSLQANVSIRNANGSLIEERSLFVGGIVEGKPLFNPDALLDFTIANVTLVNATISGTETGRDLFESKDSDAISRLQIIVKECIVPALIASKQSGLSVTNIGGFHTKNRSLMLIPNATLVTFDAFYSNE